MITGTSSVHRHKFTEMYHPPMYHPCTTPSSWGVVHLRRFATCITAKQGEFANCSGIVPPPPPSRLSAQGWYIANRGGTSLKHILPCIDHYNSPSRFNFFYIVIMWACPPNTPDMPPKSRFLSPCLMLVIEWNHINVL